MFHPFHRESILSVSSGAVARLRRWAPGRISALALAIIAGAPLERVGANPPSLEAQMARQRAFELGLPVRSARPAGSTIEVQRFDLGWPVYFTSTNLDAGRSISADALWTGSAGVPGLSGRGVGVGVWDAGSPRQTHQDLRGRVTVRDDSVVSWHATHVAATIAGRGTAPSARGVAPGARIDGYDWNDAAGELRDAARLGLRISLHAYAPVAGWYRDADNHFGHGAGALHWLGNTSISGAEDYRFGWYGPEARAFDAALASSPFHLAVVSAGNDRGEVGPIPGASHWVFNGLTWVDSTRERVVDGGVSGLDTVVGPACAKNVLTIGSVLDLPAGYAGASGVALAPGSACGPTDDGRIKPDLVANGATVYSAHGTSDTSYRTVSGTSMAAAGAAGGLALLYQYCQDRRFDPSASLVRALVIATADEAGPFPGPDYRFGWGLLNIEQAVETLRDAWSGSAGVVERALLSSSEVVRYRLRPIPGRAVTIAMSYDDPAGPEIAPSLDSRARTAVVDLDMWVSVTNPATAVGPTTSIVRPWRLDPSSPEAPASRGDNDVDTIERIDLGADPIPGLKTYILRISHEGSLAGGEQRFSLVARGAILERLPSEWRP